MRRKKQKNAGMQNQKEGMFFSSIFIFPSNVSLFFIFGFLFLITNPAVWTVSEARPGRNKNQKEK
jgi:hypothetical protein